MKLGYKHLLPFATSFFKHFQEAIKEAEANSSQIELSKLEEFVFDKIKNWNPKINKKIVLDEKSKLYCAKLIASMAINLIKE